MSEDLVEVERHNAQLRELEGMEAKRKRLDEAIQRRKDALNFNRRLDCRPLSGSQPALNRNDCPTS